MSLAPRLVSSLVVGRSAELARLASGLARVPCAVILGLAGVGKSAVARRFAAEWPHPVWVQHAREGTSLGELLDDAERQLGLRAAASEAERATALARRLDERQLLWLIEDADRVADIDGLLGELTQVLQRGRVIATARERIFPALGRGPERVELVLDGLGEEEARSLWQHLDELYGAAPGFAAAWRASGGNPFQLRQAHAGVIDAIDPAAAAIAALPPAPRRLALALALSAAPLPRAVLDGLDAPAEVSAALRALVARLIVEPAGPGRFAVHDLLRGALVREASAAELAAMHGQLARALERLPVAAIGAPGRTARADDESMDPVVCVRERVRHLLGADERAAARQLLLGQASSLIRGGAAAELLRGLEALGAPGAGRVARAADVEVQLARARTWIRMLELHRAYDQLREVVEQVDAAAAARAVALEAQVSLAHLCMLTCRLPEALAHAGAAQRAKPMPMPMRVRLVTVEALTRTALGDGDAARAAVDRLVPLEVARQAPPILRAYLLFTRAFSFWLEERDAEAEAEMRTSWALCKDVLSFRARVLAPLFFASVLARTGRRGESARVLAEVERDVAEFDDPLVQLSQRAIRMVLLECEGAFEEGLALAVEVEAAYQQAGMLLGALWARLARGRLALLTGRVRAGRALLDELARRAAELGARMLVRLAKDALRLDPLVSLAHGPRASERPGEVQRARVLAAVAAAQEGKRDIASGYLWALRRDGEGAGAESTSVVGAGDALSAALLQLVEAALAQDAVAQAELVATAVARAAAGGVDPELLPAVMARLPLGKDAAAAAAPARGAAAGDGARGDVVIALDQERHELRSGERLVSLARRPSVRRLLYTLAAEPGRAHDKDALARGIWSARYHPTRHDGALWVTIKRLREVLAGTGLSVESSDEGYRLLVDEGYRLRNNG